MKRLNNPADTQRDLYNNEFARTQIAPYSNSSTQTQQLIQQAWDNGQGAIINGQGAIINNRK